MKCCKSGKASIKFSLFKGGNFKYKKAETNAWINIEADEPLISKCEVVVLPGNYYSVGCGIDGFSCNPYCLGPITWIGNNQIQTGNGIAFFNGAGVGRNCNGDLSFTQTGGIPKYKFTVKGQTSGAEYLTLTDLDQCPEVQQEGCQLQPEQKFKLEVPFKTLPNLIYSSQLFNPFLTIPGCVSPEIDAAAHRVNIWVRYKVNGISPDPLNLLGWDRVLTFIPYDPNCPPPKVTVVCGEDKSEECPPETDCEITCNGFKCCYSKGKVIKVIPV